MNKVFATVHQASLLLPVVLLLSAYFDPDSGLARFLFFLSSFLLTAFIPQIATLLLISAFCWFELPMLQAGYPNQFFIEAAVIGWLSATYRPKPSALPKFLLDHPFVVPLLIAIPFAIFSFVSSTAELGGFSAIRPSVSTFLATFFHKIFYWDVNSSIHTASIAWAYCILLAFLLRLASLWEELRLSRLNIQMSIAIGSVPVFLLLLGQYLDPETFSLTHASDYSGTLQNGNHLSFYAGLVLCCLLSLGFMKAPKILLIPIGAMMVFALLLGMGRTTWASILAGLGITSIIYLFNIFTTGKTKQIKLTFVGFGALVLITVAGLKSLIVYGESCSMEASRLCAELYSTIQTLDIGRFGEMMSLSGRAIQIDYALQFFSQSPFLGIGLGNYFTWANIGFDLHNTYLVWLTELGLITFIIVAISIFYFLLTHLLTNSKAKLKIADFLLLFVLALTAFFDYYLSYRSPAYLVATILLLYCSEHHTYLRGFQARLPLIAVALGTLLGLTTMFSPQSRVLIDHTYTEEKTSLNDEPLIFNWYAMSAQRSWPIGKECIAIPFRTPAPGMNQSFFLHVDDKLDLRKRRLGYVSNLNELKDTKHFRYGGDWINLCVCQSKCVKCKLNIIANQSQIFSWLRGYHFDDRLLSFGLGKESQDFNQSDKAKPFCHALYEWPS